MNLNELTTNINENDILDIFMQLCRALNYLHIRGFIYGELNTNNIMISYENNKYKIILMDLPTIEIQKQDYGYNKIGQLNFKSPEYIIDNKPTIASDIYSLGVVLLALCKIDVYQNSNIHQSIVNFENKVKNQYSKGSDNIRFL